MYEVFASLLNERNITAADVSRATGIRTSTLTDWKKGRTTPKADKLQQIADYFGVSLEYLMTGEHPAEYHFDPETARIAQEIFDNPDLHTLFDSARDASPDDLKTVQMMLEALKAKEGHNDPA